jgi:serine/threonine protein kinase
MNDDETAVGTQPDPRGDTVAVGEAGRASAGALGDRYTVGHLLGRGGMGEVVSAKDEQIGRRVAIKRMRTTVTDPGTVARFLREARIQGGLDHPAIVPVHELGKDDTGAPYFVMKQLAGVTLADVLERVARGEAEPRFSRTSLLRAFVDVCLAVELAHTRGIVHRDLKPANIVLGEFGEVFVLDWGIAKVIGDPTSAFGDIATLDEGETGAGAILGTPGYMSPEQIEGGELDGRADVYALGCILFEILALTPLHLRGREGLASALAGIEVAPSSRTTSEVPPELDRICVRATAAAREARHPTARALGDEVQRYLDGDRDVALRRELAIAALASARAHLAHDPSDVDGEATRDVGRAVALDPANADAPQLLAKLMFEALPATPPPAVVAELAEADVENQLTTRRLTAVAGYGYLLAIPVLWWIGFAVWQLAMVLGAAAVMIAVGRMVHAGNVTAMSRIAVAIHMVTIVAATQFASPFLLAPLMALVVAMSNSTLTQFARPLTMAVLFLSAVLVPFALEQLGVLRRSLAIEGNRLELTFGIDALEPTATIVGLTLFVIGAIVFGSLLAGRFVDQRRAALQQTKITAWRLR